MTVLVCPRRQRFGGMGARLRLGPSGWIRETAGLSATRGPVSVRSLRGSYVGIPRVICGCARRAVVGLWHHGNNQRTGLGIGRAPFPAMRYLAATFRGFIVKHIAHGGHFFLGPTSSEIARNPFTSCSSEEQRSGAVRLAIGSS